MSTLFCDTDCELWYTTARELKLQVIQMPYTVDGVEKMFDLGENTDTHAFYEQMRAGANATTAGLNEHIYYEIFKPFFEKGEDILYIAFSSKLSSTFKYLELAINRLQEEYPGVKYRQFDTKNICMGAGLLVYMAAKYHYANGEDIDKTYSYLESIVDRVRVFFLVEDMKYLARGGRISPAKAKFGNALQIKPVLTVGPSGEIDVFAKQMGMKKAFNFMVDNFAQTYQELDDAPIVIADADNPELGDQLEQKVRELFPERTVWRQPIGPVIGVHAGPGAVGLIFTKK